MNKEKIAVPENELLEVKEYGFNEIVHLSTQHAGNTFKLTEGLLKVISTVYEMGFRSGFEESMLSNTLNKPET